ncbi:MAG: LysM peptidoglycan-binding domain-containing protein [Chloroflexi bacterium]|nr:LysM peptidoglycan-binding domain-containing protein [Chloroflexota bacterium]
MRRLTVFLMTTILLMSLGSAAVLAQQAHVVQRGENLFNIAQQYGRSVEELAQANGIAPPYVIHAGNQITIPAPGGGAQAPAPAAPAAPQQPAGETTHIVQRGESLAIIAAQYGTTYIVLAEMNGIANPDALNVGQVLRVPMRASAPAPTDTGAQAPAPQPTTGTYTVQRGDSLAIIAAKFNVNYLELARLNGIADPNILHVGQVLQVPGAPPPAAPAPAPAEAGPAPAGPPPPSTANTGGFELGGQALSFAHPGHMRNARMTWVKRQVKWHGEPASNFQHMIDSAKANGFKVLLSVIGDKNAISGNPAGYYQNFANFVAQLARGGADAIEVWNEMNIDREWPSGQISGHNYTQMLAAAYHAIKSANSGTMVISGAPAPTGFFQGCGAGGGDDDCFLQQMRDAGAANYMDCVGVHYNAGIVPPDATSGAPVGSSGHYSWYLPRMMQLYRSFFPSKPLCFTELGYLTGEGIGELPGGFAWASGISLAQQAAWLAGAVHRLRGSGYVRMFIVWNVDATHWGADPQAGYAIVRPGGGCPACDSLRVAMGG